MNSKTIPPFPELIAATTRSAVHLEMRDTYVPQDPGFRRWLETGNLDHYDFTKWRRTIGDAVGRGVRFRRARIVSEPVTDYIRYEHVLTAPNSIAAGEQVRWLPRRLASDLALPGNDFWVFDDCLVRFHHFAGDGSIVEDELRDEPEVIRLCLVAFEAVWERAIDHAEYELT
ncbi:DUF6879 family protein [Bailinhaonella thermotolerans]|uniref:DUF6879 domain-containing protein n=1 Tax=Bailinhaonella thermotolerans TaxID=1070861 RepID=A0A3A4AXE0_9ACTN|nr:DUF6879 family protein [Bailinhaonella thermotolerans]RJL29940.1 hypothetical protein D5H75_23595 [Bailinhaonella thermotolerans]